MALYRSKKTKRAKRKRSNLSRQYRNKHTVTVWRRAAVAVACIAIFAVGFFLLGPALDGFLDNSNSVFSNMLSGSETSSELLGGSSSKPSDNSSIPDTPEEKKAGSFYLSAEVFTNSARLSSVIAKAQSENVKTLVLELKGYDGKLNYISEIKKVKAISAISENAVDLSAVIAEINVAGLDCAASVQVFDELYTASEIREAAIKYNGSDTTRWLDYTRSEPSPWQDPGLAAATEYELDIIDELCKYNLTEISLSGCHYPVWGKHNGMTVDLTRTKIENIGDFISKVHAKTAAAEIRLDVRVTADVAVNDRHSRIENYGYPTDVFSLDCDSITADFRLNSIITEHYTAVEVEGTRYSDFSNRSESLALLYTAAAENAKGKKLNVLTDSDSAFTAAEMKALFELGAENVSCQITG